MKRTAGRILLFFVVTTFTPMQVPEWLRSWMKNLSKGFYGRKKYGKITRKVAVVLARTDI